MLDYIVMPGAERFIKKLKKSDKALFNKYQEAVLKICEDYTVGSVKHGDLEGYWGYEIMYNGVNYELSYILGKNENGDLIVIIAAGPRENFYEDLKTYV